MTNLSIFGLMHFFFIKTPMEKAKKSICSLIGLDLTIINSKVIPGEFLGLLDLTKVKNLYIHKLTEVDIFG